MMSRKRKVRCPRCGKTLFFKAMHRHMEKVHR